MTATPSTVDIADTSPTGFERLLLPAICTALFIEAMNVSITAIALPSIQEDLSLSTALLQWVHGAFILGFAGFLLLGGRAADLFGRKRIFLIGVAGFGVTSLTAGLSDTATALFVSRGLQGFSAALMIPAAISILTTRFPEGPSRNAALGAFNAAGAGGFSAGLIAGGFLTELLSWHWAFLINAPVAFVIFAIIVVSVERDPVSAARKPVDLGGAASGTAMLVVLILALTDAADHGFSSTTIAMIALASVLGATFLLVERRHPSPLLPPRLIKIASVGPANAASLTLLGSFFSFTFVLTLMMQRQLGMSPSAAGLLLLPMGLICVAVAQFATPRLLDRYGPKSVAIAAFSFLTLGPLALAVAVPNGATVTIIIIATLLSGGLGMGLGYATLAVAAVDGVEPRYQGIAAGLQQTSLQFGGVFGTALVVIAMNAVSNDELSVVSQIGGLIAAGAVGFAGLLLSLRIHGGSDVQVDHLPFDTYPASTAAENASE